MQLILPGQQPQTPTPIFHDREKESQFHGSFIEIDKIPDPFDLTPAKVALEPFLKQIEEMATQAKAVQIKDEASNEIAAGMAGQVKRLGKDIESARVGFVSKPNDFVKQVNGLAKGILGKLDAIERDLKFKLGDYRTRMEQERRKAEEAARKATEEAQAKIDAEAKAHNVEPVKIEAPVIPVKTEPVRTSAGTVSFRTVWKYEVTHPNNVPREFLVVDEGAIRRAIGAGVRKIEGIRIFEEKETSIRA